MKTIAEFFPTLALAEAYQDALYARYESVKAIRWPLFSEDGVYAWQVGPAEEPYVHSG